MDNFLETALSLIDQYALVFYGLGVFGLLFYFNRARLAYRQMRITPFPIEREEASANVRDAIIIMVIFVAILGTTAYIDRVLLAPPESADNGGDGIALNGGGSDTEENTNSEGSEGTENPDNSDNGDSPSILPTSTATSPAIGPTPEQSATPTNTPENTPLPAPTDTPVVVVEPPTATPIPTNTPESEAFPTETPPPTAIPTQPPPTATEAPQVPSVPAAQCGTAGVRISSPGNGAAVSGNVGISGTADIPDFQFYKVEYSQGTSLGGFASIGGTVSNAVQNGQLASWNTAGFPKGIYALRLTVVDITGNFPPPCTVFVVLQ